MGGAEVVSQLFVGQDFLDAERNYRDAGGNRLVDLTLDLAGSVGVSGKDQDHGPGFLDGLNYGCAPVGARQDIPGRDPATDTIGLQGGDDGIGGGLVLIGIADKNIMGHRYFPPEVIRGTSQRWFRITFCQPRGQHRMVMAPSYLPPGPELFRLSLGTFCCFGWIRKI